MADEKQTAEPEDQATPEVNDEPTAEAAVAQPEPTVEEAPAVAVAAGTTAASQEPEPTSFWHNRNLVIGLVAIAVSLTICLCLTSGGFAGLGIFGGDDPTPTPKPAPAATPTIAPTPEPGEPPQAVIYAPSSVTVGEGFELDGSYSTAASTIVDYVWDFGDGTGAQGPLVEHTYIRAGEYIVSLTVTDQDGLSSSSRMQITAAEEQPPVAVIVAPTDALAGEPVTFDGSGSTSANPIVNYTWDFGDRSQGSGPVVEHVYSKAGKYTAKLTVTDNTGLRGESTWDISITEQVQNPPVAILAGPTQALVGEDVTFDGSESTPGSSLIVNYAWDLGNGDVTDGKDKMQVTTQYTAAGSYEVTLTVTDENGLSSSASATINISASLEETTWSLVSDQPALNITTEFSQGEVSGFGGCNNYSGGYVSDTPEAQSGSLIIQAVTVTRKMCEEDISSAESQYLTTFESVTGFSISGDTLTLTSPGGVLTYEAVRAETR